MLVLFFTNKDSEHQPDEVPPTETFETPVNPDDLEPNPIRKTKGNSYMR